LAYCYITLYCCWRVYGILLYIKLNLNSRVSYIYICISILDDLVAIVSILYPFIFFGDSLVKRHSTFSERTFRTWSVHTSILNYRRENILYYVEVSCCESYCNWKIHCLLSGYARLETIRLKRINPSDRRYPFVREFEDRISID